MATLIQAEQQHTPQRPVYLCGESFGGCLALQLAMQFPRLVHHLILVNPASSLGRRPWLHGSGWLARTLPSELYGLSCVALVQLLVNRGRVSELVYRTLLQTVRSLPQATVARRLEQLCQFAPAPTALRRIWQPTLIVASGADRLLPSVAEAAYLQHHLPQGRSHILPHSGHACLLEPQVQLNVILAQQGWCGPGAAATPAGSGWPPLLPLAPV
ncbi:alpha/beta fold hydrolase, partial [Trichothermofontia sp.]